VGHLYGYLRVPVIVAAYLTFRLRLAEPMYVFKQVSLLSRVLDKCNGRVHLPAGALGQAT
jgi:hypothetical protein